MVRAAAPDFNQPEFQPGTYPKPGAWYIGALHPHSVGRSFNDKGLNFFDGEEWKRVKFNVKQAAPSLDGIEVL